MTLTAWGQACHMRGLGCARQAQGLVALNCMSESPPHCILKSVHQFSEVGLGLTLALVGRTGKCKPTWHPLTAAHVRRCRAG